MGATDKMRSYLRLLDNGTTFSRRNEHDGNNIKRIDYIKRNTKPLDPGGIKSAVASITTSTALIETSRILPTPDSLVPRDSSDFTPGVCAYENCSGRVHISAHISWCDEHAKQMIDPIRTDLKTAMREWPIELKDEVEELEKKSTELKLTTKEVHDLLYGEIRTGLQNAILLLQDKKNEVAEKSVKEVLQAVATYEKEFNPEPQFAEMLMLLASAAIKALTPILLNLTTAQAYAAALCTISLLALAVPVAFIAFGIWKRDILVVKLASAGLLGAAMGFLVGGPVGATVGMAGALGLAGLFSG